MWLMNGDCKEKLKEIDNNVIDMVITSPPYDNLRKYNKIIYLSLMIFFVFF